MQYFSDVTKRLYETPEALEQAEGKYRKEQEEKKLAEEKRSNERKLMAQEVEDCRKAFVDAKEAYSNALKKFCDKYGTYHTSFGTDDVRDFFRWFFF